MCDNKTLTQEVAEKITDGQNLDINEFTAMDDAAAKGLSKHERRLGPFLMASDNPLDDITDTFSNGGHPLPPDPVDVLRQHSEQVPDWLRPGIHADRRLLRRFLNSERISFYPGAGLDGQLFSVVGKSHSVHCHVHADYNVTAGEVLGALQSTEEDRIYGYDLISHINIPAYWLTPFESPDECPWESQLNTGLLAVLRRRNGFGNEHGPKFQCLLHIPVDAYWLYWNVWAKRKRAPFTVVLQDHGFAGNPGRFGGEGQLFQMASQGGLPEFLLVAENTASWPGYELVANWAPGSGMYSTRRCLYQKSPNNDLTST